MAFLANLQEILYFKTTNVNAILEEESSYPEIRVFHDLSAVYPVNSIIIALQVIILKNTREPVHVR